MPMDGQFDGAECVLSPSGDRIAWLSNIVIEPHESDFLKRLRRWIPWLAGSPPSYRQVAELRISSPDAGNIRTVARMYDVGEHINTYEILSAPFGWKNWTWRDAAANH